MLKISLGIGAAIFLLGRCENTVQEMLSVLLVEMTNTGGLHQINAMADHAHAGDDTARAEIPKFWARYGDDLL
jgi:hypothetical protein